MNEQNENEKILHRAAVGDVTANWEYLLETLEVTLLQLAGCPDNRGRVLTNWMSYFHMSRAVRILLKNKFGNDFVAKRSDYSALWARLDILRSDRNRIVHASWLASQDGIEAIVSADISNMTAVRKPLGTQEIQSIADQIAQTHEDLLSFLSDRCGFVPSPDRYELPPREDDHHPDQSR